MQRQILIIDDHDDLATSLEEVLTATGHAVQIVERREDALAIENIEGYDLVVTDLDVVPRDAASSEGNGNHAPVCLPEHIIANVGEHVKAFKICAANFRRDEFNEDELKDIVARYSITRSGTSIGKRTCRTCTRTSSSNCPARSR